VIASKSTDDLAKLSSEVPAFHTVKDFADRHITAHISFVHANNHHDCGKVLLIHNYFNFRSQFKGAYW
jgi:hypothetical protein